MAPGAPASPDPVRNGLLALASSLLLGIGFAFFLEYLDDSLRSPQEVEQVSGLLWTFAELSGRLRCPKAKRGSRETGKEPNILRLRGKAKLRRARKEYESDDLSGQLVTITSIPPATLGTTTVSVQPWHTLL